MASELRTFVKSQVDWLGSVSTSTYNNQSTLEITVHQNFVKKLCRKMLFPHGRYWTASVAGVILSPPPAGVSIHKTQSVGRLELGLPIFILTLVNCNI